MQFIDLPNLKNDHMEQNFSQSIGAAIKAGLEIMKIYGEDDFQIEIKDDNSPLTIADKKSNDTITSELKDIDLPILSEEGELVPFEIRKNWDLFW